MIDEENCRSARFQRLISQNKLYHKQRRFYRVISVKSEFFCPDLSELAKSKFRLVLHLFIFAFSFREQNLPRASFALAAKNEFVPGTCWG